MTKYMIGDNFHNYEKTTVENIEVTNESDNLFIIIVDKSLDAEIPNYYKFINNALRKHNRVILIGVEDDGKIFNVLASLMVTFESYDIYKIVSKDALSADYLLKLEKRTPEYSEVQTYIGGETTAYSDINVLIFGLQSLIEEGNQDAIKSFLEEHAISFEALANTINSMKKTCDLFNSNELINEINTLKNDKKELEGTIASKDDELKNIKFDRDKYKVDAERLQRENDKLHASIPSTNADSESNVGPTIKSFKTTNIQLLKDNKTKIVLYFKEISYVKYTNTLITILFDFIKRKNLKAKLLIYDTGSEMYNIYNPLRVINGQNYLTEKNNLIKKVEKFVVSEPSQSIINDILCSDMNFDVVIIYDRMHTLNDIVEGNLVSKFYVVNSRDEFDNIKEQLKIKDTSNIITYADSSINISKEWKVVGDREFLDIPSIKEFKMHEIQSNSFAFSKYIKQATAVSQKPLIETILTASKINTLYAKEQ